MFESDDARIVVSSNESVKAMLQDLVQVYGGNMSSVVNMLIVDKYMEEIKPFLESHKKLAK